MLRMMSSAKPNDIQLPAVVFVMTLGLRIAAHNARHPNYSARSYGPLNCSVRLSFFWVLQPELLGVFFIISRIVVSNLSNPCTVAFPATSF
jgi:hypothetical protein